MLHATEQQQQQQEVTHLGARSSMCFAMAVLALRAVGFDCALPGRDVGCWAGASPRCTPLAGAAAAEGDADGSAGGGP